MQNQRMRCVLLAAIIATTAYMCLCIRDWRAQSAIEHGDMHELERSVALEPHNAEAWYRLGASQLYSGADPATSVVALQDAVSLNPHQAKYWLDLASAERLRANPTAAREALAQALAHAPTDPAVAWEAANVALAEGDAESALRHGKTVVQFDPEHSVALLDVLWRMIHDRERIATQALPSDQNAYSDFMAVLLNHNELGELMPLWRNAEAHNLRVAPDVALSAANALLLGKRPAEARAVWTDLTKEQPRFHDYTAGPDNLVVDGGFEFELLNTALDWHLTPVAGVTVQTDGAHSHSDGRSLLIQFQQGAPQDAGVYEIIPVTGGAHYRFSLFTRVEDLRSAAPPKLVIEDDATGALLLETRELVGSSAWQQFAADIRTSPTTTALRVHITRNTDAALIKGKLWLDDVVLKEQP